MTLKDVTPGSTVVITSLMTKGIMKRKLMDMGLTRHVEVFVRKVAPFGDPIELNIRGYALSIRKQDAELIEVE